MDVGYFGLRQRPFRAILDTGAYYPATGHERCLTQLLEAVRDDEGLVLLVGEPGTGKTLLCHCLVERLGSAIKPVFLTHGRFGSRAGLLQAILFDLSVPYEGRSEQELRLALTDFVLGRFIEGQRTLLLLDEAHHLTADLLEELRLLSNLEGKAGKAVQVVLAAQRNFLDFLRQPDLESLRQRLRVRVELGRMPVEEAADYVLQHLRAAGGRPEALIGDEALEALARATKGVPRLLNQAMHQALCLAEEGGADRVDVEAVLEALGHLGLEVEEVLAEQAPEEDGLMGSDFEPEQTQKRSLLADGAMAEKSDRAQRLFASPRRPA